MRDRLFRFSPLLILTALVLGLASWLNGQHNREAIGDLRPSVSPPTADSRPESSPMELTNTDRAAIRSVIEQQLQAFQQNHAERAFSFASPGIQAQFQTPENFMAMVESAYLPVYRPRSVMFEDIQWIDGKVAQRVVIMGPEGNLFNAFYLMQRQADDSWRINGCFLTPIGGESA